MGKTYEMKILKLFWRTVRRNEYMMWDTMFLEYCKDVSSPQINLQIQNNPIQISR